MKSIVGVEELNPNLTTSFFTLNLLLELYWLLLLLLPLLVNVGLVVEVAKQDEERDSIKTNSYGVATRVVTIHC